jgi:CubicO group peptidase (beta-lactamase class C family)
MDKCKGSAVMKGWKAWLACRIGCAAMMFFACGAQAGTKATLEPADLAAFVDGYLAAELERADIAGAALVVVKDGRVLLQRGYGWADREQRIPVSPETTLFRIGSVSKPLTWTAVMQLVEQGRLSLDADVQQYLDFPLPPHEGQPVTLRRLMTHTAGFEETVQGMWLQPGEGAALGDYLRRQLPPRIFAAGQLTAYSNYGATLAGYIVERCSGEPFEHYVDRHLLQPLGMSHTTFAQPLPASLAPLMSQGYDSGSGQPQAFEAIRVAPAGSASATAADMGRFMLAHLEGSAALSTASLAKMHAPQWRLTPQAPAMTLGFWEISGFGARVIAHGGDTAWFHAGLYLVPEQRLGFFFVQNSTGRRVLRDALFRRLAERYLDAPAAPVASPSAVDEDRVEGRYAGSRRAEHSPMKLASLLSQVRVVRDPEGRLKVSSLRDANDMPLPLRRIGAGVWQSDEAVPRRVFFRRGAEGAWELGLHTPMMVWQQVPWHQTTPVVGGLLAAGLGAAALTLLAWPAGGLLRRMGWQAASPAPAGVRLRRATRLAALFALLPWLAMAGLMAVVAADTSLAGSPWFGWGLRVAQALAWLAAGALIFVSWWAWRPAMRKAGGWRRVHHAVVVCAGLAAVWVAWAGGLMWWDGRY